MDERQRQLLLGLYDESEANQSSGEIFERPFEILMLATSGVGKTSFMTAMFHDMVNGNDDLRLQTDSATMESIKQTYNELCQRKVITGTATSLRYSFTVKYKNEKLFNFAFSDYRGGDIAWDRVANSKADTRGLMQVLSYLDKANSVFVLADAEQFEQSPQAVKRDLRGIQAFIEGRLQRTRTGLHIVLVLTKADRIGLDQGIWGYRWNLGRLMEYCRQIFDPLFRELPRKYLSVWCDVIPVSAFGKAGLKPGIPGPLEPFQIKVPVHVVFAQIARVLESSIPDIEKNLLAMRHQFSADKAHAWSKLQAIGFFERFTTKGSEDYRLHKGIQAEAIRNYEACVATLHNLRKKSDLLKKIVADSNKNYTGYNL